MSIMLQPDHRCEDPNNSIQDYLKYSMYYNSDTGTGNMISTKLSQITVPTDADISIPQRSPRRLQNTKLATASNRCLNSPSTHSISSYASSTSFSDKEYTSDDSDSIFSSCEYQEWSKDKIEFKDQDHDDPDFEMLLNEIELDEFGNSNLVFAVDEVVTIVGVHTGAHLTSING